MSISDFTSAFEPRSFAPLIFGFAGATLALWLYLGFSYVLGDTPSFAERSALAVMTLSSIAMVAWVTRRK